jgi:hypothetical protein
LDLGLNSEVRKRMGWLYFFHHSKFTCSQYEVYGMDHMK